MVRDRIAKLAPSLAPARVLRSRPVRDGVSILLGVLLTAWALDVFLIPNRIAAGGVSGLATIIYHGLTDAGVPWVPSVGLQMLLMNAVLLVIGIRARGWRYGAKTLYGAVGLSVAVDVLALPAFKGVVPHLAADDPLLAVLWGGALMGLGIGLVFRVGGNTGGSDIVAQVIADRVPVAVGRLVLAVDVAVLVAAGIVLGPQYALYAAVAVFIMGVTIDIVQEGFVTERAAWIFTESPAEVCELLDSELGRGSHRFAGSDPNSGTERDVVFTVVSRNEVDTMRRIVMQVDADAFLVLSDVYEALGEGFKEYRGR